MTTADFTPKNGAGQTVEPYDSYEVEEVAVDVNAFATDPTSDQLILIDNRNFSKVLLQLYNSHATNGLSYEISGHNKETDTPPTITVAPEEWNVVPNGTGNLAAKTSIGFILTDPWAWLLLRVKRQVADDDAEYNVWARSERK